METKINITTILKDKPKGTKLYSTVHGECTFETITDEIFKIHFCTSKFGLTQTGECVLIKFGNMFDGGECVVFPSKEMRDWSKFAWKRGDVLINDAGYKIFFDKWENDDYTRFFGSVKVHCYDTEDYTLASKEEAQEFIKSIEKTYGGKLNLKTLEIEKQPEFKDGDILYCEGDSLHLPMILILKILPDKMQEYAYMNNEIYDRLHICCDKTLDAGDISRLRYATEGEKQHLFKALAKENKVWDAEKKVIVSLPKKCKFKPFDKVLGRNDKDDVWEVELFSHYREESQYPFRCIGFARKYCIPYNEETAHLLGTTDDWEGDEQ